MPSIGRISEKKKDEWAQFEDAPEQQDEWAAFEDAPDDDQINVNYEAPAGIRLEVAGLEKPEDKLAAIRKHYPDAEPRGDSNFIMTNPDNGERMMFNREGWWPSIGDVADAVPGIAEAVGAGAGGIVGGAGGAAGGSAVPVVGTAAGGVAGAMGGAAVGGAGARDLTQRGINWFYGNDDTRTLGDYVKDKAADLAINAAGEGAGMAIAKGVSLAARPIKKMIAGAAKDADAAKALTQDFNAANVPFTNGQITQNPRALRNEAELARNEAGRVAQTRDAQTDAIGSEFDRIQNGLATATDPAGRALTKQGAGDQLIDGAKQADAMLKSRLNDQYSDLDKMVGDVRSASADNTQKLLQRFNSEKKAFGASDKLNKNAQMDTAIDHAKAASTDLKKGMSFRDAQEMRSNIGKIAFDKNTDPFTAARMKELYAAVSDDMATTAKGAGDDVFKAWKDADTFNTSLFAKDGPRTGIKGLLKTDNGQDAYNLIKRGIKDGDKSLRATREQIEANGGAAQWDQYTASFLNDIGTSPNASGATVFSPDKFLKEWKGISPEAKDAMFAGSSRQQYRADLDRLGRIVEARAQGAKVKGRPVSDGDKLLNWASVGTLPASKAIRASYMDRLLTNPQVVGWMTGIPQAQMTKGGLSAHIGILRNIAREALKNGTDDGKSLSDAIGSYLSDSGFKDDDQ